MKKEYKEPKITINKVYTKRGDAGLTDIIGRHKVPKSDLRVRSYGELDELNSLIGGCQQMLIEESFSSEDKDLLIKITYRDSPQNLCESSIIVDRCYAAHI